MGESLTDHQELKVTKGARDQPSDSAGEKTDSDRKRAGGSDRQEQEEPREDEGDAGGKKEKSKGGESKDNDEEGEGKDKKEEGFHPSKKAIVITAVVLVVLIIAIVLYWLHARQFVSTDDAYTTGHVHQVSARITGTVEEVRVDDNQEVKMNDVLVRLDPRDYEVALQRAQAGLLQARAQLAQSEGKIAQSSAQLSAAKAQTLQSRSQVSQSSAQLERARADYDRIAGLYSKDIKAVSKADVDQATEAFTRARSALEGAKATLASTQAQEDAAAADVQSAEAEAEGSKANIATSETQVKDAELQLSYCNVVAPVDGKISKKTVERGQRLTPGQALMAVVPADIWVIANLKETQLERLQIGQRVDVTIDSLKHETFIGSVQSIQEGSGATFSLLPPDNATGNFTKIVQRVPVKIVFDPDSIRDFRDRIVPGLSVEPKIDLESLRDNKREAKREQRQETQNQKYESGK